jgi:signal transduction histidine kinase
VQIALGVVSTAAAVSVAGLFFATGENLLPRVATDSLTYSTLWPYFIGAPVAVANVSALIVLWLRRQSILDYWLVVVTCLYLIEVPLSYYPDPTRFSVAWYTVRVIGFLASGLVLVVLLYEITTLYARLLGAVHAQRREREARLITGNAVAASIAHEVRQPLTAMVTTADAGYRFLDRPVPNLDKAKQAFRNIAADGHRAGDVVANIRANFKTDLRERTSFDLNELIQEALGLGRGDLQKHGILVQAEPNRQLPEIRGNRVQVQQVLLNLIMNAVDAMAAREEPRILTVKSEAYEADRVLISIADTGTGISAQHSDRIFNPLFTTKPGGMGMGLSICRAIIEAHEGQLWFGPNTPRGAIFQFTLLTHDSPSASA